MKKIDDYVEAKRVIKEGVDGDLYKNRLKVSKLRALLVSTLGVAAAAAIGYASGEPLVSIGVLPLTEGLVAPLIVPYFIHKSVRKKVKDGSYFDQFSESKVIDIANNHLEEEEEYLKKHSDARKKKK